MSTISGVSGSGDAWATMKAQRSQMQAKMFAKVDTDSSGGVDKTELQNLLTDVTKKTGVTNSSSNGALFSKMDSNSDGSLSSDELSQGMQSIMPAPPSTMDFAQSRSDSTSGDNLFTKVDADGNGSVSKDELQSLMAVMDKLASDGTSDSTSSTGATSTSSADLFAKLDTDGDGSLSQTEFEAGQPKSGDGAQASNQTQGAGDAAPPPPGGASGSGSGSSSTYDPLDTNEDGVVSVKERMAATSTSTDPLQALFKAVDTNGDSKISSSESDTFIQQLTSQLEATSQSAQNTGTSASAGTDAKSAQNSVDLAELVKQAYEQIASGLAQQAKGTTLSAVA